MAEGGIGAARRKQAFAAFARHSLYCYQHCAIAPAAPGRRQTRDFQDGVCIARCIDVRSQPHRSTNRTRRTTMGSWLSEREQRLVAGAETASAATPIPTQIVSNGEYLPPPQSETQKRVERRIFELADENGKRLGLSRRQFMQTGCGMAAAFLAMNEVYGSRRVPSRRGRGARARADAGARAGSPRPVHLRCPDAFRARRLRSQGAAWTLPSSPPSTGTRR